MFRSHFTIAMMFATASAGCMSEKEAMVKRGYPLAYADGFDDGCHSGKKAGGDLFNEFRKDVRRFDDDRCYAQGWSDGFRQCESEEEALMRRTGMAIEQQRLVKERECNEKAEMRHLAREALKGIDTRSLKNLN